jgi:hypothetical protein
MDITGSKSYNINVSFHINGLQLRDSKNHTDAWFVRSLGKNSYICADGMHAISHTKDERKQFTYSSPTLSCSRGIDVDIEGNVYIVHI